MTVERFLGGAWATVHGPTDPHQLLVWTLDLGFGGVVPAPGPRPLDWRLLRAARADLPVKFTAVRVSGISDPAQLGEAGLCSGTEVEVQAAESAVGEAVALAQHLGCRDVILEPGVVPPVDDGPVDLALVGGWDQERLQALLARRQRLLAQALDRACRALHRWTRSWPEMRFCLTPSRHVGGLGEPQALAAIFEDLGRAVARQGLAYWHDTAAAACRQARLQEPSGEFLEKFCKRLAGITLGDPGDDRAYLPPGTGGVDYPLLSNYRQRSAKALPVVVELDPGVVPAELPGIHAFLNKFGL